MAEAVVLPKQGNSVESCLIMSWKKRVGEPVASGDLLVEVETDKAIVQIDSPAEGTLLARFFEEGDDVPVMTPIAVIGEQGEDVAPFRPQMPSPKSAPASPPPPAPAPTPIQSQPAPAAPAAPSDGQVFISPRARLLADRYGVNLRTVRPTGPEGRIIERDVQAVIEATPQMTPAARAKAVQEQLAVPQNGSGIGGRITTQDLHPAPAAAPDGPALLAEVPVRGIRKTIAERMHASLQQTAQVTLNTSADARALQAYRARLKHSDEALHLRRVSLNDLLMFAVARVLLEHPNLNATLENDIIRQHSAVHLGFAVDTPRGLLVPVVRDAHRLSLKALSDETTRLQVAIKAGTIAPGDLQGGTFTVSNLGALGIESFTPIINLPQVAILGVGRIDLRPVQIDAAIDFIPHLALSLTIDHQAVDGAPGARFLRALVHALENIDLWLAR